MKVREGLAPDDYKDPGWYQHPQGTVAYEWQGDQPSSTRASTDARMGIEPRGKEIELKAVKPAGKDGHEH